MNGQNPNYGGAQGGYSIPTTFTTPDSGYEKSEKRTDIQLLGPGVEPAIIFAIVELGTVEQRFGNNVEYKKLVYIGFEFAHVKQLFYVDDTEPRSSMLSKKSTFIVADKSFLKSLIEAHVGRGLSIDEAKNFNIYELLGSIVGVNINHKTSKTNGKVYENVKDVLRFNFSLPPTFKPEMDKHWFVMDRDPQGNIIGNCFNTDNFANLPAYIKYGGKNTPGVMDSFEAKDAKARGMVFKEPVKDGAPAPQQNQAQQEYQQPVQQQQAYQQGQQQFQQPQQAPQQGQQQFQQPVQQQAPQQQQQQQPNYPVQQQVPQQNQQAPQQQYQQPAQQPAQNQYQQSAQQPAQQQHQQPAQNQAQPPQYSGNPNPQQQQALQPQNNAANGFVDNDGDVPF